MLFPVLTLLATLMFLFDYITMPYYISERFAHIVGPHKTLIGDGLLDDGLLAELLRTD